MIAGLMIILAYLLPLPILGACLYFGTFDSITDMPTKIGTLAAVSLGPSAILMLMALKRMIKTVLFLVVLLGGGTVAGLEASGIINLIGK